MSRTLRKPPTWPQPAAASPSSYWIVDTVQAFALTWRDILKAYNVPELGINFAMDDDDRAAFAQRMRKVPDQYAQSLVTMGRDVQPHTLWERHRETYDVHPAMTRGLMKMKSSVTVPSAVLRRLRHPNPWFLLPGAPPVTHADGRPGRIIGIQLTGSVSKQYAQTGDRRLSDTSPRNASILLDTHDPDVNSYHAVVHSEVLTPDRTQVTDLDYCHLTIPLTSDFTLDELVARIAAAGFSWAEEMDEATQAIREEYLSTMARAVVSHLLYACSRTVELGEGRNQRPPVRRQPGQPKPPRPALVHPMGYRTGTAIEDSLRRVEEYRRTGTGTGGTKAPHTRNPHLHMYRVGPGRTEIDMKWLDLIAVNAHLDDGKTITRHVMR